MFSCGIYRNKIDITETQTNPIDEIRQKIAQPEVITQEYNY
jgi:hypothetical protein